MSYDKNCSRRDFLKTTGTAGLGLLAASAAPDLLSAQGLPEVPTRPFGKTGAEVAILSLGGMFDIPNNQLLMRQAVKWGVTYWDTANSYEGGNSEKGIGKYFAKYPEDRKKIFLVTKSTAWTQSGMSEDLDLSLERMQIDHSYAKTGVMLVELQPAALEQGELDLGEPGALDEPRQDRSKLMAAVDSVNRRYGRGAIGVASAGLEGERRGFSMRQERRTPRYTTNWLEMPIARS